MQALEQKVLEHFRTLSHTQQLEVLDFVEFLRHKQQYENSKSVESADLSFLEVAREYVGFGEGPGDLSTNPKYMEGYGT